MELKPLNSKKVKEVIGLLEKQFGFKGKLDYLFFMSSKNRLYLINSDFKDFDVSGLRVNSLGLYFGEIAYGELRPGIEGSQLIGNDCSKNILELDEDQALDWMKGNDFDIEAQDNFYLIKYKKDFLGCGKVKTNKLLNFVPKARRLNLQ